MAKEDVASAVGAVVLFSLAAVFNELFRIPVVGSTLMACGAVCMIFLTLFRAKEIVAKPLMNDIQKVIADLVVDEVRWTRITPLLLSYEDFSKCVAEATTEEGKVVEEEVRKYFKEKHGIMRQRISVALYLMTMLREIYEEEKTRMEREQAQISLGERLEREVEDVIREAEDLKELAGSLKKEKRSS